MAEKKATIVIKKITVVSGGAHGGAWKVAFADFMTALMTFFLVMWLIASSSESTRKNVADYFSSPSVIEYNFMNYGVELTLEKLFLDLINEPLKTLSTMMDPIDKTPNMMQMGMKKVIMSFLADQLGDIAEEVEITTDSVVFEIPDTYLFEKGKSTPASQFVTVMEKLKGVVGGLEDSDLIVTSIVYNEAVEGGAATAKLIAEERVDLLGRKIDASFENDTVDLTTRYGNRRDDRGKDANRGVSGFLRFEVKQKKASADGSKPRPLSEEVFGATKEADKTVYENFVKSVSEKKSKKK